jgi:hypothetical protein
MILFYVAYIDCGDYSTIEVDSAQSDQQPQPPLRRPIVINTLCDSDVSNLRQAFQRMCARTHIFSAPDKSENDRVTCLPFARSFCSEVVCFGSGSWGYFVVHSRFKVGILRAMLNSQVSTLDTDYEAIR